MGLYTVEKNKMTAKQTIQTVAGNATYVTTLSDKELWAGDYSTKNGYWVIHRGSQHHVYKVHGEEA